MITGDVAGVRRDQRASPVRDTGKITAYAGAIGVCSRRAGQEELYPTVIGAVNLSITGVWPKGLRLLHAALRL
jgi:hypothetical protein